MGGTGAKQRRQSKRREKRILNELYFSDRLGLLMSHPIIFLKIVCGRIKSYWRRKYLRRKQIKHNIAQFGPDYIPPEKRIRVGQYKRVDIVSVEEMLELFTISMNQVVDIQGYAVRLKSKRYRCFSRKGTNCVRCGRKGTHFAIEKHVSQLEGDQMAKYYHLNLYAMDRTGKEFLMTVDHIIPASKGGSDSVRNLEPMCCECNGAKADKMPEDGKGMMKQSGEKTYRSSAVRNKRRKEKKVNGDPEVDARRRESSERRKQAWKDAKAAKEYEDKNNLGS